MSLQGRLVQSLPNFAQATLAVQDHSARLTLAWTLAGRNDLLGQQSKATAVDAAAVIASLAPVAQAKAATLTDSGSGAALDGANKTLQLLATPPSFAGQLKEMIETATVVNADLAALKAAAAIATSAVAPMDATPKAAAQAAAAITPAD